MIGHSMNFLAPANDAKRSTSARRRKPRNRLAVPAILGAAAGAIAVTAFLNHRLAKTAERSNPPQGRFVCVNGVRLHYIERGTGEALVLLHGNGSIVQYFETSGLVELASEKYRVIAFDRPGYGHSSRPRNVIWTPQKQADLIHDALIALGVENATVLGHSWSCTIALELAKRYPAFVNGLILASGYYYPTPRVDVVALSLPAVPLLGDVVRYTISPLVSRLMWPLMMKTLFGPAPIPKKFDGFPKGLAVRPSQVRASASEAAMMIPYALLCPPNLAVLEMPVSIVVGGKDRLIHPEKQSGRLQKENPDQALLRLAHAGHMVHQTETEAVMGMIDQTARAACR
jgi:pimeloyl-ACP methyl ester carboxylesterase